jgi:hypothetical protein
MLPYAIGDRRELPLRRSLFHYCTIDTLESILTNGTLRFQSLQYVDDPQESEIYGSERMGRVGFVSCWTATLNESIPMWREYTGCNHSSIRIEISSELFDEIADDESLNTASKIREEQDFAISPPYKPVLFPITYTSDASLLKPKLVSEIRQVCECGKQVTAWSMNTQLLGRFKNIAWAEQHEWRFLLIALPMEVHRQHQNGDFFHVGDNASILSAEENDSPILAAMKDAIENVPLPSQHIDFPIDIRRFDPLSITLHPNISEQDRQRVNALKDRFHLNSAVRNSELRFR